MKSVDRTPGLLLPPITPITEDSFGGSQRLGGNLCESVKSVDVTPGLDPNLCKSVESVDRTPGLASLTAPIICVNL